MRPRADRGAAFVPGPPFVGATRRGEGRAGGRGLLAARGLPPGPSAPAAPPLAPEFAGVCWVDFGAAPGPLARGPAVRSERWGWGGVGS